MTYLHYADDGRMESDVAFLDAHFETGVGQYDANWDLVEAEWFMKAEGIKKRQCQLGGYEIQSIRNNAVLIYPNMYGLNGKKTVRFHLAAEHSSIIEVRTGDENGKLLGKVMVESTGGFNKYTYVTCPIIGLEDVEDICFQFIGNKNDLLHLNSFSFE